MGLLSLTYSRPAYVSGDEFRRRLSSSTESSDKEAGASSLRSGNSKVVSGIPDSLSFEKVINGETCSVSLLLLPLPSPSAAHSSLTMADCVETSR